MKKIINRIQTDVVKRYLKKFPVVAVLGARQVGKTTLVRDIIKEDRAFFSFDDPAVAMLAEKNPVSFLTQNKYITIDEVQKCPSVLSAIKQIVDKKRIPGQFLITGSANITTLPKISETLAGRIVFVELMPFTIFEICSKQTRKPNIIEIFSCKSAKECWDFLNSVKNKKISVEDIILKGGYPPAWFENDDVARQEWFKGYVRTYLERDVWSLTKIRKLYDFQRFISLAAFRCCHILNQAELAKDSGLPYTTSTQFFDLLLATFQVFLLKPYFRNIGKRLIKSPKLIWNDTGVALYLQGVNSLLEAERLGRMPFLVENKIIVEVKSLVSCYLPQAKLFYFRTSAGAEVDLVVEVDGRLIPVEVKWSEKVDYREVVGMINFFKDFSKEVPFGLVVYKGTQLLKIKDNIFLVPLMIFLG
ncbi:MAG: ATP-binding protein [Endomicrobiia bacterium]